MAGQGDGAPDLDPGNVPVRQNPQSNGSKRGGVRGFICDFVGRGRRADSGIASRGYEPCRCPEVRVTGMTDLIQISPPSDSTPAAAPAAESSLIARNVFK